MADEYSPRNQTLPPEAANDYFPRNQTLPPEIDDEYFPVNEAQSSPLDEEQLPEYDLQDASRRMLTGTADTTDDGRIVVNLDSKIAQVFAKLVEIAEEGDAFEPPPVYTSQAPWSIPMNIVLQVVGSRGDVQPFIALGNELQKFGHRVRLATHNVFKQFVQSAGLEFFPIGGDPAELMAYMVKNPGLIPNMKTLREREIQKKRKMIGEMLDGCWRSCIEPDPDSSVPFFANAIIANPPSFAHIHCAQALSIPLHLVFTMPWSATRAFPHPLANIQNSSTDPKLANYLSYGLVQVLTWQGLGDVINAWRQGIGLEPVPLTEGPFLAETLRIPYTYCWSPSLVSKPKDWPAYVDVSGFMFQASKPYTPTDELDRFLKAGSPPVYIGFGSIVVDDPNALLATVLDAVKTSGVRAIISKGWSKLDSAETPDGVLFLGDCPHDWLFQHVSAVIHHGGAGTTAAGLRYAKPTAIVPFFGDQPFWGDRIAAAGAGPTPIPYKKLTASNLADAIKVCLSQEALTAVQRIAERMSTEHGVQGAVASFHRNLPQDDVRCDIIPTLPAVYEYAKRNRHLKLCGPAAHTLIRSGKIKQGDLTLYEPKPISIENRRWDSVTGGVAVTVGMTKDLLTATNDLWYAPAKKWKQTRTTNEEAGEGSSTPKKQLATAKRAAKAAGASAMSIPKLYGVLLKGFIVDSPLAITEGLRATPRLYGEKVEDHEPITGLASGLRVAGKDMVTQFGLGLADLAVQPYKGAQEEGAIGFVKGFGRGVLGTFFKTGTGLLGLVAYPAQGAWKSIYSLAHANTKKGIASARRVHDIYFASSEAGKVDEQMVLETFDALKKPKRTLSRPLSRLSSRSTERVSTPEPQAQE